MAILSLPKRDFSEYRGNKLKINHANFEDDMTTLLQSNRDFQIIREYWTSDGTNNHFEVIIRGATHMDHIYTFSDDIEEAVSAAVKELEALMKGKGQG